MRRASAQTTLPSADMTASIEVRRVNWAPTRWTVSSWRAHVDPLAPDPGHDICRELACIEPRQRDLVAREVLPAHPFQHDRCHRRRRARATISCRSASPSRRRMRVKGLAPAPATPGGRPIVAIGRSAPSASASSRTADWAPTAWHSSDSVRVRSATDSHRPRCRGPTQPGGRTSCAR